MEANLYQGISQCEPKAYKQIKKAQNIAHFWHLLTLLFQNGTIAALFRKKFIKF